MGYNSNGEVLSRHWGGYKVGTNCKERIKEKEG